MASLPEGTKVLDGRFKILRSLGRGGMGEVYLGEQVSLARKVALKVLKTDVSTQPAALERFKREALLLSTVDHPAVVRVIDFGSDAGAAWLVMDLVEGRNLRDVLDVEGPFAPERALRLLHQLADGLSAIHDKGIIHRDLKPENVVLTQAARGEQAKLLDFGIARLIEPQELSPSVTQDGLVLGTPEYVSPEQAMGSELDSRSDIYSFGVLAFRMLAGRLPFEGPSPRQFMAQHAAVPPKRIEEVNAALLSHPGLSALVMRCLEKDPRARPQRADELSTVLESMRQVFSGSHPAVSGSQPAVPAGGTQRMGAVLPATSGAHFSPPPPKPVSNAVTGKTLHLTLMLTDIKGFTAKTSQQTREENERMLKDHDGLLLPIIESYSGKLRQKRGDALLVTFTSPTEAVLCGMAIQDGLFRFNESVPETRKLTVRVCIHSGEVLVQDDAIFGEPLKVVEAVEGEADGGEVCFTEAVRLQMNRAEVEHGPRGQLTFAGNTLALYKATPAPQGLPFGGRDARQTPTRTSLPSATQVQRTLSRFTTLMTPKRKRVAGGVCGLLAVAAAVWMFSGDSTAALARDAIKNGRPKEALNILTLTEREQKKLTPALQQLRAVALHRVDEHRRDLSTLRGLGKANFERVEPLVFGMLAAHARSAQAREIISWIDKGQLRDGFANLVEGPPNEEQWGALSYLDTEGALKGRPLVKGYARALDSSSCEVREAAIARLEKLGDDWAVSALESIKPRKESGIGGFMAGLSGDDCGVTRGKQAAARLRKK